MRKAFQDSQDFELIFKEYFEVLCNFINSYTNNWELSREIVQNTFVKVWNRRNSIEVKSTVKNYLFQAAKNNMIDYIRIQKSKVELTESLAINLVDQAPSDQEMKAILIQKAIKKGLSTLKPRNREIFELNKFEGLTYREIASRLNISERAVEDNIARCLKSLRKILKSEENLDLLK